MGFFHREEGGCVPICTNDRYELDPHGTQAFSCMGYEERLDKEAREEVPWHWHEDFEAVVVFEGHIRVAVPGVSVVLEAGDAAFINTEALHCLEGEPRGLFRSAVFATTFVSGSETTQIHERYVAPLLAGDCAQLVVLRGSVAQDREAIGSLRDAIEALEREQDGFEIDCREGLARFVLAAGRRAGTASDVPGVSSRSEGRTQIMCRFIDKHLSERITVADIAAAAAVSARVCLRDFHDALGTTPQAYVEQRRLMRAAQLLVHDRAASVAEVARAVGIPQASYFSKRFSQQFGVTPREYRKVREIRTSA